jgi:hypothetical protein
VKIMVFLHGTAIMHRNAVGRTREERVGQVQSGEASVRDFASYVPVGHAVSKLQAWKAQGAEIIYLIEVNLLLALSDPMSENSRAGIIRMQRRERWWEEET